MYMKPVYTEMVKKLLVRNLGLNDFLVANDKSVVMDKFQNRLLLVRNSGLNDFLVANDKSVAGRVNVHEDRRTCTGPRVGDLSKKHKTE